MAHFKMSPLQLITDTNWIIVFSHFLLALSCRVIADSSVDVGHGYILGFEANSGTLRFSHDSGASAEVSFVAMEEKDYHGNTIHNTAGIVAFTDFTRQRFESEQGSISQTDLDISAGEQIQTTYISYGGTLEPLGPNIIVDAYFLEQGGTRRSCTNVAMSRHQVLIRYTVSHWHWFVDAGAYVDVTMKVSSTVNQDVIRYLPCVSCGISFYIFLHWAIYILT